jgi:hypothetical protein
VIYIPLNTTKNDEPLPMPLSEELVRMLKKQFHKDGDSMFVTTNFRKAFQAACVTVNLGRKTGPKIWQYKGYFLPSASVCDSQYEACRGDHRSSHENLGSQDARRGLSLGGATIKELLHESRP